MLGGLSKGQSVLIHAGASGVGQLLFPRGAAAGGWGGGGGGGGAAGGGRGGGGGGGGPQRWGFGWWVGR